MYRMSALLPLWAVLIRVFAAIYPTFLALLKPVIVPLLGVVMFTILAELR
ncbi:MAG: hypothetical protein L0Y67_01110 [Gammaproteobacteria bacterium]|nr:hypothetical protein [Gammaproteobacteria bacterium]MCI0590203.1 hypothetical protein [Gammaproteobacteria bacterium]